MQKLTPYLMCSDTDAAIAWYTRVFGAVETRERMLAPNGACMNAEVRIGEFVLMLADAMPQHGTLSPLRAEGTTVVLDMYVDDVDAVFAKALEQGATQVFPVADQFYGDRAGRIRDPFGHAWILATKIEDVSGEEMKQRFDALFGG